MLILFYHEYLYKLICLLFILLVYLLNINTIYKINKLENG